MNTDIEKILSEYADFIEELGLVPVAGNAVSGM